MRNPFLLRASEQNVSDEEFTQFFAPGVLGLLPSGADQWTKPLLIQSAPGAGKTSLFRLFSPGVLRQVVNARNSEKPELYNRLRELKVVSSDGALLLGISLACRSSFSRIDRLQASETAKERAFMALFNSRVVLATLRAAASYSQVRYPTQLAELQFGSRPDVGGEAVGPISGNQLFDWASSIEQNLFKAFDSFDVHNCTIPGHEAFAVISWLQGLSITGPQGRKIPKQTILMIDDVHDLTPGQRRLLVDEALKERRRQGIWLAERLQALRTEEMLSQGASAGRDYQASVRIEQAWSKLQKPFEAFLSGIADRRVTQADDMHMTSFSPLLSGTFQPSAAQSQRLLASIDRSQSAFEEETRVQSFYAPLIASVESETDMALHERAILWRALVIIKERDARKKQTTLELFETTDREADDLRGGVRTAAELFLAQECELPFYFGSQRVADAASWNVDQFLRIAGDLFEQVSAASLLGEPTEIIPVQQQTCLKAAARKYWEEIPIRVPHGYSAQRLVDAIGRFSKSVTDQPNAPYAPGVTGVAITMQQQHQLYSKEGQRQHPALGDVIAACLANNLLEARPEARAKGQVWYVLFLNRLLCVRFDLPFSYGGWRPVSVAQLVKWSESGYQGDSRLDMALEA